MLFMEQPIKAREGTAYSIWFKESEWAQGLTIETISSYERPLSVMPFKPDVVVVDGKTMISDEPRIIRDELRLSGYFGPVILIVETQKPGPTFTHKNRVADQIVYAPFDYLRASADLFVERSRKLRRGEQVDSIVGHGDLTLDLLTGEVRRGDHSVFFEDVGTFEMLLFMVRNAGRTLSERDLVHAAVGESVRYMDTFSAAASSQIYQLKHCIEPKGAVPMIHSEGDRGYRLEAAH